VKVDLSERALAEMQRIEFNRHIVGMIEVVVEFHKDAD
jgi:hypothetical protein